MSGEPIAWKGSICFGTDRDELWLRMIGVKLGPAEPGGWHPCEMSEKAFARLDGRWGVFFWSLEPVPPFVPSKLVAMRGDPERLHGGMLGSSTPSSARGDSDG